MPIKLRVDGATQPITGMKVMIAGVLRPVAFVKVRHSGSLRTVFAAAQEAALSATAEPDAVAGFALSDGRVNVVSPSVIATVTGGVAPYSYKWTIVSGGARPTSPITATTEFIESLLNETSDSQAKCTVTDALGAKAECLCSITLNADNLN